MFGWLIAFIRIRSPSSAPPDFRRVGSTEMIASRRLSSWSSLKRRTSSSVSELLPAPPVPVMPSVGVFTVSARLCSAVCSFGSSLPFSSAVTSCASARRERPIASRPASSSARASAGSASASSDVGAYFERSTSLRCSMSAIMPGRPIFCPSSGL